MNEFWIVINSNGTYAGIPCATFEEATELAAQKEGRRIFLVCENYEIFYD